MTPEEEARFTEKLTKQFSLIPRNRLFHVFGGALALLVVAFGVSIGGVMTYLRTEPAEIARKRLLQILAEVEDQKKALGAHNFVKFDDAITLRSGLHTDMVLNAQNESSMGGRLVNHKGGPQSGPSAKWIVLRASK